MSIETISNVAGTWFGIIVVLFGGFMCGYFFAVSAPEWLIPSALISVYGTAAIFDSKG